MSEQRSPAGRAVNARNESSEVFAWLDIARLILARWRLLLLVPLLVGLVAAAATYLVTPLFTARVSFLPPQQQQSAAAAALSQLGGLAGIAGAAAGLRSPAEQYVAIMQSVTVVDRLVDRFKLRDVYGKEFKVDARNRLLESSRASVGKKDGLIAIEVDDTDPQRAADIANAFVEELSKTLGSLSISEAQLRRAFFEQRLAEARDDLTKAQEALQQSGFSQGALRTEPKAAAEAYARLKAEISSSEVRLLALRQSRTEGATEVQQAKTALGGLRAQLARIEQNTPTDSSSDYISRFRDFKYRETLFELFAKQYELARVDEAREGSLIQIVDKAYAPEKKSWPRRGIFAMFMTASTTVLLCLGLLATEIWRRSSAVRYGTTPTDQKP